MNKKLNPEQTLLCQELNKTYYSHLLKIMKYSTLLMPGMTLTLAKFLVPDRVKAKILFALGFFTIVSMLFKISLIINSIHKLNYCQLLSDICNSCYFTEQGTLHSYKKGTDSQYVITVEGRGYLIPCYSKCLKAILNQHNLCKVVSFRKNNFKMVIPRGINGLLFDIDI